MNVDGAMRQELQRIRRVADTLCTGHANLRDRYTRRALVLDLAILGLSTWLVALAFVEPRINIKLTPFGWDGQVWVGVLGAATFFLALFQLKTDWKARADAHKRTLNLYAEVKREAGYLIASDKFDEQDWRRVLARYDMASAVGVELPEAEFLRQKQKHVMKVALSRHLDAHPGTSLPLARLKIWLRDNIGSQRSGG